MRHLGTRRNVTQEDLDRAKNKLKNTLLISRTKSE